MSIEKQTCHCFQGLLGPSSSGSEVSSCIKVLQTLGCFAVQDAIDIKVLQTLGTARDRPSPYGNMDMSGMSDGDAGLVKVGFLIVLGFFGCSL